MSIAVTAPVMSKPVQFTPEFEEKVRLRAYEIYERRGATPGDALQDWLQAEAELSATSPEAPAVEAKARTTKSPARKPAAKKKSAGR